MAAQIPDELAQQQGDRRLTWADFDRRANGVAAALLAADGAAEQDKVAQYLYNSPEYLESVFAAFKAGMAVVNTNYRYAADELVYLWDNADVTAVVFHGSFADTVRRRPRPRPASDQRGSGSTTAVGPLPRLGDAVRGRCRCRGHRRTRHWPVGPVRRPPPAALHRRDDRHAEGRDVAPGRPVRRARRQQQEADATRTGPRRRHSATVAKAGPRNMPARSADARHRVVQRDQQPDGRRLDHHDGRSVTSAPRSSSTASSSYGINSTSIVGDAFAKPILRGTRRRARSMGHLLARVSSCRRGSCGRRRPRTGSCDTTPG